MMMRVSVGERWGSKSVSSRRDRGGGMEGSVAEERSMSSTAIILTLGTWAWMAVICAGGVLVCVRTTLASLLCT